MKKNLICVLSILLSVSSFQLYSQARDPGEFEQPAPKPATDCYRIVLNVIRMVSQAVEQQDMKELLYDIGYRGNICGTDELAGAGCFPKTDGYGFPSDDVVALPDGLALHTDEWGEVGLLLTNEADIERVWAETCVRAWRTAAGLDKVEV